MLRRTLADTRGSASVEFVISVPVLVLMIWGIFQIGLIFQANAGMQHALGQAARYATLCLNPTAAGCSTPTDADIQAMITSNKFGLVNGIWGTPTITTDGTTGAKTITVSYSQPTDFLFFQGPQVTLTESKTVYLSI